jgi:hypothetical protein
MKPDLSLRMSGRNIILASLRDITALDPRIHFRISFRLPDYSFSVISTNIRLERAGHFICTSVYLYLEMNSLLLL